MKKIKFSSNKSIKLLTLIEKLIKIKVESFTDPDQSQKSKFLLKLDINKFEIVIMNERGFNVLDNNFFVAEFKSIDKFKKKNVTFNTFEDFYSYVDGDIYENSCYFGYLFNEKHISRYKIDISKLNFISFTSKKISDETYEKFLQSQKDNNEQYNTLETVLPPFNENKINLKVTKKYENGFFEVVLDWYDTNTLVGSLRKKFRYIFDFIYYLENDLSSADLIMCDGLENVDFSNLKINDIIIRSDIAIKNNIQIEKLEIDDKHKLIFDSTMELEKRYDIVYKTNHIADNINDDNFHEIFYISDLHLLHKFNDEKFQTKEDFEYLLNKIYEMFEKNINSNNVFFLNLLIAGDISSDFKTNNYFLSKFTEKFKLLNIFYTLGNHELWGYKNKDLNYIVDLYRNCSNKCYLVHNNIYYFEENKSIHSSDVNEILENDLMSFSISELRDKLRKAKLIIFGGIGFSGKNERFNASNNIYDGLITREEEIKESEKFDELYKKVSLALYDKNVIVLTHMPFEDWSYEKTRVNNFVYVSGHNHKNIFYDDGEIRIYSDNQVGYNWKSLQFKSFGINKTYDYFSDYSDGIYKISKEDYISFIKGKNIQMSFKRDLDIFMLKKNKYYCFLTKNNKNEIGIFNGGTYTIIGKNDITYYFDNMDRLISLINEPLTKYREMQEKIAKEVKAIGGDGKIHGCIIDIDFFNHIYVNPSDGTITPYYALDMIYKIVYDSIPALLEEKCPNLYINYIDLAKKENTLLKFNTKIKRNAFLYENTDIYSASRIIKKMQKLSQNILTIWDDEYILSGKMLK